eukprot:4378569-Ditylum_brightwellii.AAC.1
MEILLSDVWEEEAHGWHGCHSWSGSLIKIVVLVGVNVFPFTECFSDSCCGCWGLLSTKVQCENFKGERVMNSAGIVMLGRRDVA